LKGRNLSEEHKRKISISTKGRIGGRLGKKASVETRNKISQSNKGKTCSSKGTKWWTNDKGERKRLAECPGKNWKRGMK
jgi:hypothetical protein